MNNIKEEFGLTSHQVGHLVKQNKLRTVDSKPSLLAFDLLMVEQNFDGYGHYIWLWHVKKMHLLLERLGHKRVFDTLTE